MNIVFSDRLLAELERAYPEVEAIAADPDGRRTLGMNLVRLAHMNASDGNRRTFTLTGSGIVAGFMPKLDSKEALQFIAIAQEKNGDFELSFDLLFH